MYCDSIISSSKTGKIISNNRGEESVTLGTGDGQQTQPSGSRNALFIELHDSYAGVCIGLKMILIYVLSYLLHMIKCYKEHKAGKED